MLYHEDMHECIAKKTILHHGQKITRVSFHYSNKISELPKTTLEQHK
jgi:hypothetical protein